MYGDKFKEATKSLMSYCRENMGYDSDPDVHYVTDKNNANSMLGTTAHYQPDKRIVTVYISNRHPKDALRSLAHELVHHAQNCRGDLQNVKTEEGYAQTDPHMRKMEEEAYLTGNMMFRDWEDTCKANQTLNLNLPSTIGENKMSDQLNRLVAEKVIAQLNEQGIEIDEGFLSRLMAKGRGKLAGVGTRLKGAKAGFMGDPSGVEDPKEAEATAMLKQRLPKAVKQIEKVVGDIVGDMEKLGLRKDKRVTSALKAALSAQTQLRNALAALAQQATGSGSEEDKKDDETLGEADPEGLQNYIDSTFRENVEEVEEAKKPDEDGDGVPDWADKKPGKDDNEDEKDKDDDDDKKEKSDKDMSKVPPQLRKHVAKKVQEKVEKILQEKSYGITTSPKHDQSLTGRPVQGKDAKKPKEKATGVDFGAIKTHKMDDKKPGKPKRIGKGDGKGNFSTVQDVNEEEVEEMRRGAPQAVQAAKKKKEEEIRKAREKRGQFKEGFYRNPDARGQGGQDIDSGVGKSALGNMGAAHNKLRKDSRLLKQLQGEFIGDISLLKYGKSGQSPRRIKNVIRKYKKKAAEAGIEFEVPNFEDVLAEKVENELTDIKKGQDSIKKLNEQRNQKLNDELMRRLLK